MELKPARTYQEQVSMLKRRSCIIEDEAACIDFLHKVNYYRLTAYFLPFRNADHTYRDGTTFERIKGIYEFDQWLRVLIFAVVEEIEVYTRTKLAYYHSHKYGPHGYWDAKNYNDLHKHERFIDQLEAELERNKNALWVKHHQRIYDGKFPIWAIVELFPLGMLSRFYADLPLDDRKQIAAEFNTKEAYLGSWLRALTLLRNICAHYGRLYYAMFTSIPKIPPHLKLKHTGMLFDQILTLKLLTPDPSTWNTVFLENISTLVEEYFGFIELAHVGFTDEWEDILRNATP